MPETARVSADELIEEVRERLRHRHITRELDSLRAIQASLGENRTLHDLTNLRAHVEACLRFHDQVGVLNPRPPGPHNWLAQVIKRIVRRLLTWYSRPLREFQAAVARAQGEQLIALQNLHQILETQSRSLHALAVETGAALRKLEQRITAVSEAEATSIQTSQRDGRH